MSLKRAHRVLMDCELETWLEAHPQWKCDWVMSPERDNVAIIACLPDGRRGQMVLASRFFTDHVLGVRGAFVWVLEYIESEFDKQLEEMIDRLTEPDA